jgi:hypothetical protein
VHLLSNLVVSGESGQISCVERIQGGHSDVVCEIKFSIGEGRHHKKQWWSLSCRVEGLKGRKGEVAVGWVRVIHIHPC